MPFNPSKPVDKLSSLGDVVHKLDAEPMLGGNLILCSFDASAFPKTFPHKLNRVYRAGFVGLRADAISVSPPATVANADTLITIINLTGLALNDVPVYVI